MVRGLCPPFDLESYRAGHLTPVFFGSALNNFGVRELLAGRRRARAPAARRSRRASARSSPTRRRSRASCSRSRPTWIPKHRDRIAFVRLASGHFTRGMKLTHAAHRQGARRAQRDAVPGPRARAGRGGVGRRHHRHPQPRHAAHRRRADRGRGAALHRHPQLRAGIPAPRAPRRSDEGQAPRPRARAARRRRRRAGVQAAPRHRTSSSAWSARCSSTCSPTASAANTTCPCHFEATCVRGRALGRRRRSASLSRSSPTPIATTSPRTTAARPVFLARNDWQLDRAKQDFPSCGSCRPASRRR